MKINYGVLTLIQPRKVIGEVNSTHTHKEWLSFPRQMDREHPQGLTLHVVQDNYATHKHAAVTEWIEKTNRRHERKHGAKRITPHFTPPPLDARDHTALQWASHIRDHRGHESCEHNSREDKSMALRLLTARKPFK